jgi:hypothetical protein
MSVSTCKQKRQQDSEDARLRLRELGVRSGRTIYTILHRVSRSGMQRSISLRLIRRGSATRDDQVLDISPLVAILLDLSRSRYGGIKVDGCGMDMGFHLVYQLSSAMFPKGFKCLHPRAAKTRVLYERCPSNDHSNGEHPPHHRDGGYALRHKWM